MDPLILLFSECLQVSAETLNDDSSPDTVSQWDSLAAMALVASIEEQFSVTLSTREIMSMRTIGIARNVLRKKGVTGL